MTTASPADRNQRAVTFPEMRALARALPRNECRRHAAVSRDRNHKCNACFTCACLEVSNRRVLRAGRNQGTGT